MTLSSPEGNRGTFPTTNVQFSRRRSPPCLRFCSGAFCSSSAGPWRFWPYRLSIHLAASSAVPHHWRRGSRSARSHLSRDHAPVPFAGRSVSHLTCMSEDRELSIRCNLARTTARQNGSPHAALIGTVPWLFFPYPVLLCSLIRRHLFLGGLHASPRIPRPIGHSRRSGLALVHIILKAIAEQTLPRKFSATDSVTLGGTGIKTSRLAMGTGTVGVEHHSHQTALGVKGLSDLLLNGYDHGLRFFDAADSYGSHPHVAEALKHVKRDQVTVLTKSWARDACRNARRSRALPP